MNILNKVNKYLVEADEKNLKQKIFDFFKKNPKPEDEAGVHKFAEELGMNTHKFEEAIYAVLGSFFGAGFAKRDGFTEKDADPEQLKMGIKVEMEHTSDPLIAKRIALDHLTEIKDYYTRLAKMEKEAGVEESEQINERMPDTPCPKCGGRQTHRPGCPRLQASIRRGSEREEAKRRAQGKPTTPKI